MDSKKADQGTRGFVFWLTGLSGAGKTSLATAVTQSLRLRGIPTMILDGDVMRRGLCADLGFSLKDRQENNRPCAEVAKLLADSDHICLCAFITPLENMRQTVRGIVGNDYYREVFVDCDINTCIARDPKGNYRKAQQGHIKNYSGLDAAFEPPLCPGPHHQHGY